VNRRTEQHSWTNGGRTSPSSRTQTPHGRLCYTDRRVCYRNGRLCYTHGRLDLFCLQLLSCCPACQHPPGSKDSDSCEMHRITGGVHRTSVLSQPRSSPAMERSVPPFPKWIGPITQGFGRSRMLLQTVRQQASTSCCGVNLAERQNCTKSAAHFARLFHALARIPHALESRDKSLLLHAFARIPCTFRQWFYWLSGKVMPSLIPSISGSGFGGGI
jgi:hypothetical protein